MIRVVLVDDQTLVRSGIRGLLELTDDIRVCAEAADGAEAIDAVRHMAPDVLLLDVRLPGMSGIEVLGRLGELAALPPTLLLTTFDDDEALLAGMRAGARGFLLKDITLDRLADAIRAVAAGESLFLPGISERVMQALRKMPAEPRGTVDLLTSREVEIIRLMAAGFSNKEIGDAFQLSDGTVKNHVSSILSKLGTPNRVRAVLRGIELGYV